MKRIFIFTIVAAAFLLSDVTAAFAQSGVVTSSSMIVTRTKIKKERKPIEIRWQNSIDVTVSDYGQISYTGGWRFGNFLYLGFGAGVQVHYKVMPWDGDELVIKNFADHESVEGHHTPEDYGDDYGLIYPSRISAPVYLHMKFRFLKTKVSPYLAVSGGMLFQGDYEYDERGKDYDSDYGSYTSYAFTKAGIEAVFYAEAMVGIDLRLKNESNLYLGLGPIWAGKGPVEIHSYGVGIDPLAIGGFKLGYSF